MKHGNKRFKNILNFYDILYIFKLFAQKIHHMHNNNNNNRIFFFFKALPLF